MPEVRERELFDLVHEVVREYIKRGADPCEAACAAARQLGKDFEEMAYATGTMHQLTIAPSNCLLIYELMQERRLSRERSSAP